MNYDTVHFLAAEIKESEEYQTYHRLKEDLMTDQTASALIKEYRKLQISLQMSTLSGQGASQDDMQRFQGISSLLFSSPSAQQYMLAEMRLQQMLADIFKIITEAADIDIQLPL